MAAAAAVVAAVTATDRPVHASSTRARADWRARKRFVTVRGTQMAAVDTGPPPQRGDRPPLTVIFLHGNPTSSYLWRNIVAEIAPQHRCIAPDLVGMGDSGKLGSAVPDRYSFQSHRTYLDGLLDALEIGDRTALVLHDWGGMLGFDWARRHPSVVRGIAHMETVMDSVSSATAPASVLAFFARYRSAEGRRAVLEENQFVEQVLLRGLQDVLSDADREEYRRPFAEPGDGRLPTLIWPTEIPVDDEPRDVAEIFAACRTWLATAPVPKLFVNVEPGAMVASPGRKATCRSWPNTTEVVVAGNHFIQEQAPQSVAAALRRWLPTLA